MNTVVSVQNLIKNIKLLVLKTIQVIINIIPNLTILTHLRRIVFKNTYVKMKLKPIVG